MSIQDPDEPRAMMIDDPARFRDEVVRRKAAEKRVEELTEELRQQRNCTLLAEQQCENLEGDIDALRANVRTLIDEREGLQRTLAHTLDRASAAESRVATLVEQLGEAERALLGRTIAEQRAASRDGAAQPVVEPRDGLLRDGWRWKRSIDEWHAVRDNDGAEVMLNNHDDENPAEVRVDCGWAPVDVVLAVIQRNGYATHPSGTEGPTVARMRARALRALQPGEEPTDWWSALDDIATMPAEPASLPDGTAPERVRRVTESELLAVNDALLSATNGARMMQDVDGRKLWAIDAQKVVDAREALARLIIATRPLDGTAPERADDATELDNLRRDVAFAHGKLNAMGIEQTGGLGGASLRHRMKLLVARAEQELDAARPPDGMPGEPAQTLVECDGEGVLAPDGVEGYTRCPGCPRCAAPPTVPGEPLVGVGCARCGKPVGNTVFTVCDDCWTVGFEAVQQDWRGLTPPLTTVDEDAVRRDERAKTELDIAEVLQLGGLGLIAMAIRQSDYPRRSEGAG